MCRISDKIKFCTCAVSLERLKNYWILHRFVKGKLELVVGEPLMPYEVDKQTDAYNERVLLKRVNEPDAFDVSLNAYEKDRLQIFFQSGESPVKYMNYGFVFKSGRWVKKDFNSFEWMRRHEASSYGKLKNVFR